MREAAFCVLVGFAALAAAAGADRDGPAVGSRWEYEFRDQQFAARSQTFRVEVAGIENGVVREWFFPQGGDISLANIDTARLQFIERPLGGETRVLELSPYWLPPRAARARAPAGYPGGVAVLWEIDVPSYTEEGITVPAGTFPTLRVEIKGRAPAFGQGTVGVGHVPTRFVYTIWYSRDAGRYVQLRHQTWNRWNQPTGNEIVQLLGFQRAR